MSFQINVNSTMFLENFQDPRVFEVFIGTSKSEPSANSADFQPKRSSICFQEPVLTGKHGGFSFVSGVRLHLIFQEVVQ